MYINQLGCVWVKKQFYITRKTTDRVMIMLIVQFI